MGSSQEPTFSSASTAAQVNACALDLLPVCAKELIAGSAAGASAKTAVEPLERAKILLQTITEGFQSFGILQSLRKLWQYEGIRAFYKGNGAGVLRMVPYAALHYMTNEQYRCWILNNFAPSVGTGPVVDLLAGSAAGGTAVLCTYPLDLARTKLTYQVSNVAQPGNALGNSGRHLRLHGGVAAQEPGAGRGAPRRPHPPRGVRQDPARVLGRPRRPPPGPALTGEMRKAANLEMLLGDKERELRCCHKLAAHVEKTNVFVTKVACFNLASLPPVASLRLEDSSKLTLNEATQDAFY